MPGKLFCMNSPKLTSEVVVRCPGGLHMRPADRLVRLAGGFSATIEIGRGGEMMDCKSILSLLTLGAAEGDKLNLAVEGSDAAEALDSIVHWFDNPTPEQDSAEDTAGVAE